MADKFKIRVRTLQADTGWSYAACGNLLMKHGGDYNKALADAKSRAPRKVEPSHG